MTHIFSEEVEGTSDKSLSAAIASAIASALKGFDGDHKLSVTVIVIGYEFDGKEFHVKVSFQIMDYNLAQDDLYHMEEENREKRDHISEAMATSFVAANYHKDTFHHDHGAEHAHSDDAVQTLESKVDSESPVFNPAHDHITLVAPDIVHTQIHNENLAAMENAPKHDHTAPSLDLNGGNHGHGRAA